MSPETVRIRVTSTVRDEFSSRTKEIIARRTGYLCAICHCATTGPAQNPLQAKSIGVAAHITAAAPGGPRYDATLTSAERKSPENGIWSCQNCGKEIDSDVGRFTVESLREYRLRAETAAGERFAIRNRHGPELAQAERTARSAATTVVRQWKSVYRYGEQRLVQLNLRNRAMVADAETLPHMDTGTSDRGLRNANACRERQVH